MKSRSPSAVGLVKAELAHHTDNNETVVQPTSFRPVSNDDLYSVARAPGFDPKPRSLIVAPGIDGLSGSDAAAAQYEILGEARSRLYPIKLGRVFDAIERSNGRKVAISFLVDVKSRGIHLFLATVLRRIQQDNILRLQPLGMNSNRA